MENIKNKLNNVFFNFIKQPFLCSIISTILLLILMQCILPFDPMLLLVNLLLVYWAMNKYMVIE